MNTERLIKKYDKPVPRYTSYPTVPDWNVASFDLNAYQSRLKSVFADHQADGISLYIHLPYCESLCTYCGCNTRITVNHKVEEPYIDAVLKEWQMYVSLLEAKPLIKEIHLGGGTPTFFSPENLRTLIQGILQLSELHKDYEFSFEGHPGNTTYEHLKELAGLGFSRVSYGIQDFDDKVQMAINRRQTFKEVEEVTAWSRALGYKSVNYDLIYGLPFQTLATIEDTVKKVSELMPDRIAFYSYAHVPWKRPGQRAYGEADLPKGEEKRQLNVLGNKMLKAIGYESIGMDHFVLPKDSLYQASKEGQLHRNFMGYTLNPGKLLIGLGVSSISDISEGYAQNVKSVEGYMEKIGQDQWPIFKGHLMTTEEVVTKEQVIHIACQQQFDATPLTTEQQEKVEEMVAEGLLNLSSGSYYVTSLGRQFLRNICAIFDPNYTKQRAGKVFSQAV